jgi:hypothetical protein
MGDLFASGVGPDHAATSAYTYSSRDTSLHNKRIWGVVGGPQLRVSQTRIRDHRAVQDELGYSLRYPTYREGLTAQKEEEDQRAAANGNGSGARSAGVRVRAAEAGGGGFDPLQGRFR